MRVRRIDTIRLDATKRTPEGYIDTAGNLTRTGVFPYAREDGTTQLELRLPEHVFDPESLKSFDGQPLTLQHPRVNLDSESVRQHMVGVIVSPHKAEDGEHMRARIRIMDRDAVRAVDGGIKELSNGYETELVPIPGGVFRRDDYNDGKEIRADFIQTNIRGNHTALVDKGRAGPSARLDSAGHEKEDDGMDPKELQAELDKANAALAAFRAAESAGKAKADAEMKARADEAERLRGENEQLKADVKRRADAAAQAHRAALAARVAPIVREDAAELAKLSEDDIMRKALTVMSPEVKTDGWPTAMLQGAFEMGLVAESRRVDSASQAAGVLGAIRTTELKEDKEENASEAAYQAMNASFRNAYKPKAQA